MTAAVAVLLAVAEELAEQAKNSLPDIREGECIRREWYENDKYYRETTFNGEIYTYLYDFKQRKAAFRRYELYDGNFSSKLLKLLAVFAYTLAAANAPIVAV